MEVYSTSKKLSVMKYGKYDNECVRFSVFNTCKKYGYRGEGIVKLTLNIISFDTGKTNE